MLPKKSKPLEILKADLRECLEMGKSARSNTETIIRECRELSERSEKLIQESRRWRSVAGEKLR